MKAIKYIVFVVLLMTLSLPVTAQNLYGGILKALNFRFDLLPDFRHAEYKSFSEWVSEQFVCPEWVSKEENEIIIYATFIVDKSGKLKDVSVLRSTNHALDEYVVGLIASSPEWIPATKNKEPVSVSMAVPIIIKKNSKSSRSSQSSKNHNYVYYSNFIDSTGLEEAAR